MNLFFNYVIYFMIYSVMGWIMEVIVTFVGNKKFVNRGFLIGPYCPIYGWGALFIILLVGNTDDFLAVFLKAILVCSLLEYFTSLVMEKLFNIRWWDYSSKKFNINGRICLETMIPFGCMALFLIYVVHPFVEGITCKMSDTLVLVVAIIFIIIYVIDNIVSTKVLLKIKSKISFERKDNTEKVKKYVLKWIEENSVWTRRVKNAFPKFSIFKK